MARSHLEPGPDHPIKIERRIAPAKVTTGGVQIIDASVYLLLAEAAYPGVAYFSRDFVGSTVDLVRSERTSWCPYKGEANYFHIRLQNGALAEDAIWTYENPFPAVAEIKDHLAFYPDRVDSITLD